MSLTYQIYLSSLNKETPRENNDWGQHYDMESQILINALNPLTHPILNQIKENKENKENKELTQLTYETQKDIESGLKQALQNYTANQSNNSHKCSCKSSIITSVIYIAHLVLFIMLFK